MDEQDSSIPGTSSFDCREVKVQNNGYFNVATMSVTGQTISNIDKLCNEPVLPLMHVRHNEMNEQDGSITETSSFDCREVNIQNSEDLNVTRMTIKGQTISNIDKLCNEPVLSIIQKYLKIVLLNKINSTSGLQFKTDGRSLKSIPYEEIKVQQICKLPNISSEDFISNIRNRLKIKVSSNGNLENIPCKDIKIECLKDSTAEQSIFKTNETVSQVTESHNITRTENFNINCPNETQNKVSESTYDSRQCDEIKVESCEDSTTKQCVFITQDTLNETLVSNLTELYNVTSDEDVHITNKIKTEVSEDNFESMQCDEIKIEGVDSTAEHSFLEIDDTLNERVSQFTELFSNESTIANIQNKIKTEVSRDIPLESAHNHLKGKNIKDASSIDLSLVQKQDTFNKMVTSKNSELCNDNLFLNIPKKLKTVLSNPKTLKRPHPEELKENENVCNETFTSKVAILHHKINKDFLGDIKKKRKSGFDESNESALESSHIKDVDRNIAYIMPRINGQSTLNQILELQSAEQHSEINDDNCDFRRKVIPEISNWTQCKEVKIEHPADFTGETPIIKIEDISTLHTEVDDKDFINFPSESTPTPSCSEKCVVSRSCLQQYFHANGGPFPCPHCNKVYVKRACFVKHLKVHVGVFKCPYCNISFSSACKLDTHTCFDGKVSPFKCSHCNKTYKNAATFRGHMINHANNCAFWCPQCKEVIISLSNFRNHIIYHSSRKTLRCCNVTFPNSSIFNVHLIVHMVNGCKKCTDCHKQFPNCSALKEHYLVHIDQRQ